MNSSDSNMTTINNIANNVVIKTEPGLPGRLSSFKQPRDLMLNSSTIVKQPPKKVFTPNLNVVRNKNKHLLIVDNNKTKRKNERFERNERPKGNQNKGPGIVKSTGVFSEGVAAGPKRYHLRENYSGGNSRDSSSGLSKPVLKLKSETKLEKDFEGIHIKSYISDDDSEEEFMSTQLLPVRLPIGAGLFLPKKDAEKKIPQIKQEVVVKTEPIENFLIKEPPSETVNHKIKTEPIEAKNVVECFQNPKMSLFTLQFPDSLPGKGPDSASEVKEKSDVNDDDYEVPDLCDFSHLQEGQIGKIVIFQSGKVKLVIGDTYYDLNLSTQPLLKQDVMSISVDAEERTGTMIHLGETNIKLTAMPDWDKMLGVEKFEDI